MIVEQSFNCKRNLFFFESFYHMIYSMKNILFYKSNMGHTLKYAQALKRKIIPLEIYPIKKISNKLIKDVDNIFFGGPLRNNKIEGLDKFLSKYEKFEDKNIFIFSTGIEPITEEKKMDIIEANGLNFYHVRFYMLPGGIDLAKLSKFKRFIILKGLEIAAKKEKQDVSLIKSSLSNHIDRTSDAYLDKMIDVYRKIIIRK